MKLAIFKIIVTSLICAILLGGICGLSMLWGTAFPKHIFLGSLGYAIIFNVILALLPLIKHRPPKHTPTPPVKPVKAEILDI